MLTKNKTEKDAYRIHAVFRKNKGNRCQFRRENSFRLKRSHENCNMSVTIVLM
jgi:hypothetical protein